MLTGTWLYCVQNLLLLSFCLSSSMISNVNSISSSVYFYSFTLKKSMTNKVLCILGLWGSIHCHTSVAMLSSAKWLWCHHFMGTVLDEILPTTHRSYSSLTLQKKIGVTHNDVKIWKHFLHYWPFVQRIHQSLMASQHKRPAIDTFD